MESAKRWMAPEEAQAATEDESARKSTRQPQEGASPRYPTQQRAAAAATKPSPPKSAKKGMKKKKLRSVPESLPFLSGTNERIADMILEEEARAKRKVGKSPRPEDWTPEEVAGFFRAVHVHGALQLRVLACFAFLFTSHAKQVSSARATFSSTHRLERMEKDRQGSEDSNESAGEVVRPEAGEEVPRPEKVLPREAGSQIGRAHV